MDDDILHEVARAIAAVRFGENWVWTDLPLERREEAFAQAQAAIDVLRPEFDEFAIAAMEICRDLAAAPPPLDRASGLAVCALCSGRVQERPVRYGNVDWHASDCPYRRAWLIWEQG